MPHRRVCAVQMQLDELMTCYVRGSRGNAASLFACSPEGRRRHACVSAVAHQPREPPASTQPPARHCVPSCRRPAGRGAGHPQPIRPIPRCPRPISPRLPQLQPVRNLPQWHALLCMAQSVPGASTSPMTPGSQCLSMWTPRQCPPARRGRPGGTQGSAHSIGSTPPRSFRIPARGSTVAALDGSSACWPRSGCTRVHDIPPRRCREGASVHIF